MRRVSHPAFTLSAYGLRREKDREKGREWRGKTRGGPKGHGQRGSPEACPKSRTHATLLRQEIKGRREETKREEGGDKKARQKRRERRFSSAKHNCYLSHVRGMGKGEGGRDTQGGRWKKVKGLPPFSLIPCGSLDCMEHSAGLLVFLGKKKGKVREKKEKHRERGR